MYKMLFKSIYYIYDKYIYGTDLKKMHGSTITKIHAISAFSFLEALNIMTVADLIKFSAFININIWIHVIWGIILYFVNWSVFLTTELDQKPPNIYLILAIVYILGSVALVCWSI